MRTQGALVAAILAISLYFALFWGFDALRILTSPTYGLDDVWRSQTLFGLGRFLNLGPEALIKLAAMFGALKLVVAGACAVHIFERFRSLISGTSDAGVLEGGLMLAVAITIVSIAPALWTENADLIREQLLQLLLAGLAAALLIFERSAQSRAETERAGGEIELSARPARVWYAPWR
ncbi:MAG: hypothetical protein ACR2K5_14315 [Pseudolabrys sp.]